MRTPEDHTPRGGAIASRARALAAALLISGAIAQARSDEPGRDLRGDPLPRGALARGVLEGHEDAVLSIAFAKDGTLVSGSADATALVWRAP